MSVLLLALAMLWLPACDSNETATSSQSAPASSAQSSNTESNASPAAGRSTDSQAAAVAASATAPNEGKKVKHLNFGCFNFSDSFDPATNVNSSWLGIRYGMTESLFKFSNTIEVEPNLCDTYSVSDDYRTWTFHIRDGVTFSNGTKLTATKVKDSIERLYAMTDPDQGGQGNSKPKGYLIYQSIAADDEKGTVTIVTETPNPNVHGILAYPYFAIIDTAVADKEIIGTGPYKIRELDTGVSALMERNESYWNGEVPFDTVTILFVADSSTKSMALQSGNIDMVENITTSSDLKKLEADSRFKISVAPGVRTGNAYMNFKGVLGNEKLRQAIITAIDRETMCLITVSNMYSAGISVLPSSLNYNYDQLIDPFPFNQARAIEILDQAGIVDSDGDGWRELDGKNIDLNFVAFVSRNLNEFAEAISLQLAEIGLKVTVNIRDYDTAMGLQNLGEFDLITSNALTVPVGDPFEFLGNWYSGNSHDYGFYVNSEYDSIYEQLKAEMDTKKRIELITRLQQILIDDASTIVFGYYNSRMFSNAEKITGADIYTIDYYWLTSNIKPVE
jgi:ABC-type transport system substrate-binding protein